MSSKLDMSLAEISQRTNPPKTKGGRGRGRGRRRGRGRGRGGRGGRSRSSGVRGRRSSNSKGYGRRNSKQQSAYNQTSNNQSFQSSQISITNLDFSVSEADIREIFSKVGKVKKAVVHYNAKGKSRGTAVVTFATKASASKAVKEYHQAEVDGRPMYVKYLSVSGTVRKSSPNVRQQSRKKVQKRVTKRNNSSQKKRGRGRGRGRGRKQYTKQVTKSAEELDKEMDDYYSKGDTAGVDAVAAGQPDTAKLFSTDGAEE